MEKIDLTWANQQLEKSRADEVVSECVINLINYVSAFADLDSKTFRQVIDTFCDLSLGYSLSSNEVPGSDGEYDEDGYRDFDNLEDLDIWKPAVPGQIKPGDSVRVLFDAFGTDVGAIHNGRRGTVVATDYGDVIVSVDADRRAAISGAHYPPQYLEKLQK
jgi:hypothetical protein